MSDDVPFGQVVQPLTVQPALELERRISNDVLAVHARRDLIAGLAQQLSKLLTPLLVDEFLRHPGRRFADRTSTRAHDEFSASMADGGLGDRLQRSLLLTEAVSSIVDRWLHTASAASDAALADRGVLARVFGVKLPFVAAEPRGADGWRLIDERGHSVVFKSRSLAMESALGQVLQWLTDQGLSLDLLAPLTVTSERHGWTQHLEPVAGASPDDDRCFDRRVGMLIAVNHALGGGDMHRGNVRRVGPHPVILDAEKVLRPSYPGDEPVPSMDVLSTGWLPIPGLPEQRASCGLATEHWVDRGGPLVGAGTDAVRIRPRRIMLDAVQRQLAPTITDRRRADIRSGFEEAYRLISSRGLPLYSFSCCEVRVVVRYFGHYWAATDRLFVPPAAFSAEAQRQVEERLLRSPSTLEAMGARRHLVERVELHAVRQMRAPRFTIPATGTSLAGEGELIGSPFAACPLARSSEIQRSMSTDLLPDLGREIDRALVAAGEDQPIPMANGAGGRWRVVDDPPG